MVRFGIRVYASGRKSFIGTFRVKGRQRFVTQERFGEMTPDQARTRAMGTLFRARQGEDPIAGKEVEENLPFMTDLRECYQRDHAEVRKKANGAYQDLKT